MTGTGEPGTPVATERSKPAQDGSFRSARVYHAVDPSLPSRILAQGALGRERVEMGICTPQPYKPVESPPRPSRGHKYLSSSSPAGKPVIKQSPWCDYTLLTPLGLEPLLSTK